MPRSKRWFRALGATTLALIAIALILSPLFGGGGKNSPSLNKALKAIDTKTLQKHLLLLADDSFKGRDSGSDECHNAAVYIAEQYEKAGLKPGGTDGFFQPFGKAGSRGSLADANYLRISKDKHGKKVEKFELEEDFRPAKFSGVGVAEGPVVFGGYGISSEDHDYDDYADLDVTDCIVLVLDHEPQEHDADSAFDGTSPTQWSDIRTKAETAQEKGARALLVVRDSEHHDGETGFPEDDEIAWPASDNRMSIPVAYVSADAADAILKPARKKLEDLQSEINETFKTSADDLKGYTATIKVADEGPVVGGQKNIIALKEGSDPELKNEFVIISAHYDHIGLGSQRTSKGGIGNIHNGADDNASGTSGLLELADAMNHIDFKRSILLISFDAEEQGLVGSKHFAGNPNYPMDKIVTILNIDMISRNGAAEIFVGGIGRNAVLDGILTDLAKKYGLTMKTEGMNQYLQRSDQWPLMEKGVPGLFFFGGMHKDYHTSQDTSDKCNVGKMRLITQVVLVFLDEVANGESPRK